MLLSGRSLSEIGAKSVREKISYLPQRVSLFRGSIKYNVVLGRESVDDAAYQRAMDVSGLSSMVASLLHI